MLRATHKQMHQYASAFTGFSQKQATAIDCRCAKPVKQVTGKSCESNEKLTRFLHSHFHIRRRIHRRIRLPLKIQPRTCSQRLLKIRNELDERSSTA
jgi:hypothetical protein